MFQKDILDSILSSVELHTSSSKFVKKSDFGEMKEANFENVNSFIEGLESCKMIDGLSLEFYTEEFSDQVCDEINSFINDFYYHG